MCSSSTNSTTSGWEASRSTPLSRSSNSPRYLVPATMPPRSTDTIRTPRSASGTRPSTIRAAIPSTTAVFPTPGSPSSTGLFLLRRASTSTTCAISASRPITGSSRPARASAVRSWPWRSSVGVRRGGRDGPGPDDGSGRLGPSGRGRGSSRRSSSRRSSSRPGSPNSSPRSRSTSRPTSPSSSESAGRPRSSSWESGTGDLLGNGCSSRVPVRGPACPSHRRSRSAAPRRGVHGAAQRPPDLPRVLLIMRAREPAGRPVDEGHGRQPDGSPDLPAVLLIMGGAAMTALGRGGQGPGGAGTADP